VLQFTSKCAELYGPAPSDVIPPEPSPNSSPANGHYDTGSDLLPKLGSLAAAGYSYEPSPRQLQVGHGAPRSESFTVVSAPPHPPDTSHANGIGA
jgi:hypothetical protein